MSYKAKSLQFKPKEMPESGLERNILNFTAFAPPKMVSTILKEYGNLWETLSLSLLTKRQRGGGWSRGVHRPIRLWKTYYEKGG